MQQTARLAPLGRERLVRLIEAGVSFSAVETVCGCTPKTNGKAERFIQTALR